jgi:hypothetical protein
MITSVGLDWCNVTWRFAGELVKKIPTKWSKRSCFEILGEELTGRWGNQDAWAHPAQSVSGIQGNMLQIILTGNRICAVGVYYSMFFNIGENISQ